MRRWIAAAICIGVMVLTAGAQETSTLPYMNPNLPAEARAADLVHRMTLEEKASQLVNQARAIPRLNVPAYDWWSEALHGVAVNGTTEFPEPIGLAATFDAPGIHEMATAIGIEGRIKHVQAERAGHSNIFEGLDFWAPNVNIFRDPRWGRGQETYGEDPFLTARMAVAFVTGMQGDDPKYYQVISTPKHFAVHSGPEPTRHMADVDVSKHDEIDTYLPAFRAAVTEGHAGSVMCAYNAIKGQPACANEFLLQDQLRGKWGFQGYVVSDCGAVIDIFAGHHYRTTQAQASAISLERGMDNECADFFAKVKDNHDYKPYIDAVQQGYLSESAIDTALIRLFTARMKLGMFDPPEMVPYAKIDEKELDSAEHRALARKLADESMVLLKNDGVLPLKTSVTKIAVVGPLADQTKVLMGNYSGTPTHSVSVLDGLKAEFPNAKIKFVPGTQFLRNDGDPVPDKLLTTPDGKPGLKADYALGRGMELGPGARPTPLTSRVEPNLDLTDSNLPPEAQGKPSLSVEWSGFLTPPATGDYLLGVSAGGFAQVTLDGKADRAGVQHGGRAGQAGQGASGAGPESIHRCDVWPIRRRQAARAIVVGAGTARRRRRKLWQQPEEADVVIAVVGITSELEGEEMPVSEPGFLGGDRTSLDLPKPEEALLEALGPRASRWSLC